MYCYRNSHKFFSNLFLDIYRHRDIINAFVFPLYLFSYSAIRQDTSHVLCSSIELPLGYRFYSKRNLMRTTYANTMYYICQTTHFVYAYMYSYRVEPMYSSPVSLTATKKKTEASETQTNNSSNSQRQKTSLCWFL